MKNTRKLILSIALIILGISMALVGAILLAEWNKEKGEVKPSQQSITAESTGAKDADKSLKGGFLYLAPGAEYTMVGGSLTGGTNAYGGAVYVSEGATFIMKGGTITECFAKYGGAIYVEAGGTCKILGGKIIGNYAEYAPAIYAEESAVVEMDTANSEIVNNNYKKFSMTEVTIYVDGSVNKNFVTFDANYTLDKEEMPLSNEECCGYFLDEDLIECAEETLDLSNTDQISLYTKTASDLSNFTFIEQTVSSFTSKTATADSTTYIVQASSKDISGDIVIPKEYKGYQVELYDGTEPSKWAFWGCENITSLVLPAGIEEIGYYSFHSCYSLEGVNIPDSVTSINNNAFYECKKLSSVTIPNSVKNISLYAFYGCTALKKVYYDSNLEDWVNIFFGGTTSNPMYYGEALYLEGDLFSAETLEIPEGTTSISRGYINLKAKDLIIPSSVVQIEDSALYGGGFTNVYYGSSIDNWLKINFENVYSNPMYYATNLYLEGEFYVGETLEVAEDTTAIHYGYIGLSSIKNIVIPSSVKTIYSTAFYKCSGLTNVYYGGTLDDWISIDFQSNFYSNPLHTAQNLYLNEELFDEESLEIPQGTATINKHSYIGLRTLTSVTIPSSVTKIDLDAFRDCKNLMDVYYGSDLNSWVNIDHVGDFGNPMNYAQNLYLEGVLFAEEVVDIPEGTKTIKVSAYTGLKSIKNINIPDGVTSIANGAFRNCSGLVSVVIPDSVTKIESKAFMDCSSLTNITLPNNLTSIGLQAFYHCKSLTSIYIPSSVTSIVATSANISPFLACSSSLKIYCGAKSKPDGWNNYWNYYSGTSTTEPLAVEWGVAREEYESAVNTSSASFKSINVVRYKKEEVFSLLSCFL